MAIVLILLFLTVPLIEILLFIKVGGAIGALPTILIILTTAIAGGILLRVQGLSVWRRAQSSLNRNEVPVAEVFDGLCLLLAGLLLLTPGFLTDSFGLLLFIPPLRRGIGRGLLRRLLVPRGPRRRPSTVIEADYFEIKDDDDDGPKGAAPPR